MSQVGLAIKNVNIGELELSPPKDSLHLNVNINGQALNFSRKATGYPTCLVMRLHLPHAVVVRFHVHNTDFVILTPELASSIGD